jgi:ribosomal protein S19
MRSKWKSYYKDTSLVNSNKLYKKSSIITTEFLNKRVLVYNGNKFISLLVKESMLGHRFGEFILTKSLGSKIHVKK